MQNVTFQQIEAFLTVARFQNMSKSAKSLYISQPTLSKTLQRFENSIGMRVFTRTNHGVTMTPEGKYLYNAFKSLYPKMNDAIVSAQRLTPDSSCTLRIVEPSSFDAAADYDPLKRQVNAYMERYPDVVLAEQLCDFSELRSHLEFGDADIAFSHDFAVSDIPGIEYRRVSKYKLHLAMSSQHPLAVYDAPPWDAVANNTFLAVPHANGSVVAENIIRKCREYKFIPTRIEFPNNFATMLHMIRNGQGMSICGRFMDEISNGIKYYPLNSDGDYAYLVVAWYADRLTTQSRNFIDMLPGGDPDT